MKIFLLAVLFCAVHGLKTEVSMLHTDRPIVRWHDNFPCNSGSFQVTDIQNNKSTTHPFSTKVQSFRFPANVFVTRHVYNMIMKCQDGRISDVHTFGLQLSRSDWEPSVWIQGPVPNNLYRKTFTVSYAQTATLHIAVAGYYEVFVNGNRINADSVLDPGFTHFSVRTLSVAYYNIPVTQGQNSIGVSVGGGWYGMSAGYGQTPNVRVLLLGQEGQPLAFTDDSWTVNQGPIQSDSVYNGETYDATKEINGWNKPNFNDNGWKAATLVNAQAFNPEITLRTFPPIKINSTISPIAITNPENGVWVLDFGRTISGFTMLKGVVGPKGSRVVMHHGEIMDHYNSSRKNLVYFKNLRTALATDTYILKGTGAESYTPHFTYHGYRYVQIDSWPSGSTPQLSNFVALQFYSAVEATGSFSCSNNLINTVHLHTVWGQANNLMSVPTDCNQRDERLGWMADAWLSSDEAVLNYDMYTFYKNYLALIRDDQLPGGGVGDVTPFIRYGSNPGDPSWGSAYPIILEHFYNFQDVDTVREHFQGSKDWTDYLIRSAAQTGLPTMVGSYGDWVPPPPAQRVPISMTSSYSLLKSVGIVIETAQMLGYTDIVTQYTATLKSLQSQYNAAWYVNASTGYSIWQSGDVLAMGLNVAPSTIGTVLVNKVTAKSNHFDTGMIGLRELFPQLTTIGRFDLAYSVATQTSYPGFGYEYLNSVETPATTLWELWDAPAEGDGMNSRDHIMDGSIDAWFYRSVAGLQAGKNLQVNIPKAHYTSLRHATARTRTAYGTMSVTWERTGGVQCIYETAPHNVTLDCGAGVLTHVDFTSVGQPQGICSAYQANEECHSPIDLSMCLGKSKCFLTEWWNGAKLCGKKRPRIAIRAQCSVPAKLVVATYVPHTTTVTLPIPPLSNAKIIKVGQSEIMNAVGDSHQTVVEQGTHQWVVTGNHPLKLKQKVNAFKSTTLSCPANTKFSHVAGVHGACDAQALLHHVESFCSQKETCDMYVTASPVLKTDCNHGAVLEYICA